MREPLVRGGGARRGVRLAGPPPPTGYQCLSYALTRFFSGFSRVWFGLRGCSGSKSADAGLGTGSSSGLRTCGSSWWVVEDSQRKLAWSLL